MERLSDKAIEIINELHTERLDYESEYLPLIECAQKCAAYEDTGLTPKEIVKRNEAYIEIMTRTYGPFRQKISQWLQADQAGRLVVLPCKVGDTVYFPVESRWDSATIEHIEVLPSGVRFFWVQYDIGPETSELWDAGDFEMEDIGKTVFLTRQDAEEALREATEHG